jgi:signal peptidase I
MGRTFLKGVAWFLGVSTVIGIIVYFVWLDAWVVPTDDVRLGPAIAPNLKEGDTLLISRSTGGTLGWLLRCPDPDAPGRFVLGRVIATGGQTIKIERDVVFIDGRALTLPTSCSQENWTVVNPATGEEVKLFCHVEELGSQYHEVLHLPSGGEGKTESTIDPGKAFLVSDDRHIHMDSRDYGQVDLNQCQHVVFRLWSAQGWGDGAGRLTLLY